MYPDRIGLGRIRFDYFHLFFSQFLFACFRLSETFDRFEIETLEENRNGRGHSHGHDRLRRQSLRDHTRRSVSHSHSHGHNQSYNNSRSCRTTPVVNRSHHHRASSQERRSFSRHERSRSRSAQVQSRQNVRKSSVKDRLGTPVKRPSKPRLPWSPQPSTSQQQPPPPQQQQQQHHDTEQHSFNGNEAQALDELDGTADESQETFDMSDLNSILSKCICKCLELPNWRCACAPLKFFVSIF